MSGDTPPDQTYLIGDPSASYIVPEFTIGSSNYCNGLTLTYTMSVSPSTGTTVDDATRTVTWYSSDNSDAGDHTVTVTASATGIDG